MRYIDAEPLLKRTIELEAEAMKQVLKQEPLEDPVNWNRWSVILGERTAFKYDLIDAPTVDAIPVIRCKDCIYSMGNYKYCKNDVWVTEMENCYCHWGKRRNDG